MKGQVMILVWDASGKHEEVWAQVGQGKRRRLGTSLAKPDNRWLTERGIDLTKVNTVEWNGPLSCWVVKLSS